MKYLSIIILILVMTGCVTIPTEKDPRGLNGLIVSDKTGENILVIKYEGNNFYRLWDVKSNGSINISE